MSSQMKEDRFWYLAMALGLLRELDAQIEEEPLSQWEAGMNHGESVNITEADRIQILKTAGFVKIKKEKNDE